MTNVRTITSRKGREKKRQKATLLKRMYKHKAVYMFIIPAIIWYVIFCYVPMYGITLAFKDYQFNKGMLYSPWVGLRYIKQFVTHYDFMRIVKNTVVISSMKLFITFPAPIILALSLNEVKNGRFKKFVQTASYLPYFVSWVVVVSLMEKFLTPNFGPVNEWLNQLFGIEPIYFMGEKAFFYPIVVLSEIWKNIGWGSIIYLAAISGIDPMLYEAAYVDGANRWQQIIKITLPSLLPTIGILFILNIGNFVRLGFDQMYLLQKPSLMQVSEILDTYIVKVGIKQGQFSYATAVQLFQSTFSLFLVLTVNKLTKKISGISLW